MVGVMPLLSLALSVFVLFLPDIALLLGYTPLQVLGTAGGLWGLLAALLLLAAASKPDSYYS